MLLFIFTIATESHFRIVLVGIQGITYPVRANSAIKFVTISCTFWSSRSVSFKPLNEVFPSSGSGSKMNGKSSPWPTPGSVCRRGNMEYSLVFNTYPQGEFKSMFQSLVIYFIYGRIFSVEKIEHIQLPHTQDLRFSLQCCWGFMSPEMWYNTTLMTQCHILENLNPLPHTYSRFMLNVRLVHCIIFYKCTDPKNESDVT